MSAPQSRLPAPAVFPSRSLAASATPPTRVLLAILFVLGAGSVFCVMTGIAKILGEHYSSLQVSWARAFGHVLFMLAAFLPRNGLRLLRSRRPRLQLCRSALLYGSNLAYFFAITFMPLADAAAVNQTAPLIVAILAWPMLRERTTLPMALAAVGGFAGVLIIIRPGTAVFHTASLAVLFSAACYATYQILTRKVAPFDSPATSTVYSSVVGAFAMLFVMPFVWKTPHTARDVLFFCSMGVLGATGHYCVARALSYAPANIVSPFLYTQLLGSVMVGYLFFGDIPDLFSWLGGAVIVACGLSLGWSQARKRA
jgi:drug/metabolite transporter (DMT)-like permease